MRTVLHITIIDPGYASPGLSPELLSSATGLLRVRTGEYARMTADHLGTSKLSQRTDDTDFAYRILNRSQFGSVVFLHHPLAVGRMVVSFTHSELDAGMIWYKHNGGNASSDVIDFNVGPADLAIAAGIIMRLF